MTSLLKEFEKMGIEATEKWMDRISYSRDSSTAKMLEIRAGEVETLPQIIVRPKNTEEVSQVLKFANLQSVPVVPYGAGSGVCGGAIPLQQGIVLDLKKLDQFIKLDEKHLRLRAQCGMMGEILERELNRKGYTLGHFPSSIYTATLGGYIACRSAGQFSSKYGKIEDMVTWMKVVLPSGEIVEVSHDDHRWFSELILGSEGILGVVTEAELKIHPLPEKKKYFAYDFESVSQGLEAIRLFMQKGLKPTVIRLYDPLDTFIFSSHKTKSKQESSSSLLPDKFFDLLGLAKRGSLQMLLLQPSLLNKAIDLALKKSILILGFEGAAWKVDHEAAEVQQICKREGGKYLGEEPGWRWLRRRYAVSYKMSPLIDQGFFVDTMEVASSWTNLATLYENMRKAIGAEALVMAHFSHAYAEGCSIYFTFMGYSPGKEASLKHHKKVWEKAMHTCIQSGGTISHHHGVGFLKTSGFIEEMGPLMDWWKKSKDFLDPHRLLNPGKMGL